MDDQNNNTGSGVQSPAPVSARPLMAETFGVGDYAVRLEDHPLVKAGEVHQIVEMFGGGYLGFAKPIGGEWNPKGWRKCDADGWMPWSGGENPVPNARVEIRLRNFDPVHGDGMAGFANSMDWAHRDDDSDIIAFRFSRPASEQPVGAIGAGREEIARIIDPASFMFGENELDAKTYNGSRAAAFDKADRIIAALSPASPARTPMGEPVAWIERQNDGTRYGEPKRWPPSDRARSYAQEMGRTIEPLYAAASPARTPMGGEDIGEEYDVAAHCVTLAECPPGLFFWNGTIGFKSEYEAMESAGDGGKAWRVGNRPDAYCADSGEFFWGGTSTHEDRAKVLVMPIDAQTVAMVASHGPEALAAPTPMGGEVEALREVLRLTRERIQSWPLDDQETCMCGSPVEGHGIGSGHSPISQADHAISLLVESINEALAAPVPVKESDLEGALIEALAVEFEDAGSEVPYSVIAERVAARVSDGFAASSPSPAQGGTLDPVLFDHAWKMVQAIRGGGTPPFLWPDQAADQAATYLLTRLDERNAMIAPPSVQPVEVK